MTKEASNNKCEAGHREEATKLVKRYTTNLGAAGFIPLPFVELAVVPVFQLKMIRDLADLYEVPYYENRTKALLVTITGAGFVFSAGRFLSSLLKVVPGVGFVSGAISASVLGGASTYAIGKAFTEHFETGGTLLTMDAEKIKAHYQSLLQPKVQVVEEVKYNGVKP